MLPKTSNRPRANFEEACRDLAERLRRRSQEIEAAVLTRIRSTAPVDPDADLEYVHGFRAAVRSAIEYTISTVESAGGPEQPVPTALLIQARIASRHGVGLETVLRRYRLGSHTLGDFILREVEHAGDWRGSLGRLLAGQNAALERALEELEHEFSREPLGNPRSPDARQVDLVRRHLAGEPVDTSTIDYPFEVHHVGVVTEALDPMPLLRHLAAVANGRLLHIRPGGAVFWAWIGARHRVDPVQLQVEADRNEIDPIRLAFGECEFGSQGWARTHRQAQEAFPYAVRGCTKSARYADIALVAAVESSETAAISLRQLYIRPLEEQPDGSLLPTLRAYFAANRTAASAAALLQVSRQTVSKRLASIEALLGKPLSACCAELEVVLRLETPPLD